MNKACGVMSEARARGRNSDRTCQRTRHQGASAGSVPRSRHQLLDVGLETDARTCALLKEKFACLSAARKIHSIINTID